MGFVVDIYFQPHNLTLTLLVANLANTKWCEKTQEMTGTLVNGYSPESTRQGLSNEYQDDRV